MNTRCHGNHIVPPMPRGIFASQGISKPRIRKISAALWGCYNAQAFGAGAESMGKGRTPIEAFDAWQLNNRLGKYAGMASDFAQVERSGEKVMRGSGQPEDRTSAKLKRFSIWLAIGLVWFGLSLGFYGVYSALAMVMKAH